MNCTASPLRVRISGNPKACAAAMLPLQPSRLVSSPAHLLTASQRRLAVCNALQTQTSNPAFQYGNFRESIRQTPSSAGTMTMDGAMGKTAFLLLITVAGAAYSWNMFFQGLAAATSKGALVALTGSLQQTTMITGISAFVLSIATFMKPHWADKTAPLYAACKGAALGAFSAALEFRYPGLVMSTVMLTMGIAGGLLAAFKANLIEVSDRFRNIVTVSIGGIAVTYLMSMLLGLVGIKMTFLHAGPVGLALAGFTAFIAASSMLLDFEQLRSMEYQRMPKWMEWYGGFSVLVSLLWLYFEILRFASIFMNMRDEN